MYNLNRKYFGFSIRNTLHSRRSLSAGQLWSLISKKEKGFETFIHFKNSAFLFTEILNPFEKQKQSQKQLYTGMFHA